MVKKNVKIIFKKLLKMYEKSGLNVIYSFNEFYSCTRQRFEHVITGWTKDYANPG